MHFLKSVPEFSVSAFFERWSRAPERLATALACITPGDGGTVTAKIGTCGLARISRSDCTVTRDTI
jgi:hypothetical protein